MEVGIEVEIEVGMEVGIVFGINVWIEAGIESWNRNFELKVVIEFGNEVGIEVGNENGFEVAIEVGIEYFSYRVEYYPINNFCWSIINPILLSIHSHTASRINNYSQQLKISPSFAVDSLPDAVFYSIPPNKCISHRLECHPIFIFDWSIINPTLLSIQPHTASQTNN